MARVAAQSAGSSSRVCALVVSRRRVEMGADGKTSREERRKQRELEEGRKVRDASIAIARWGRGGGGARGTKNRRRVDPAAVGDDEGANWGGARERTND